MKRGTIKLWAIVLISLVAVAAAIAQSSSGVLELISVSSEEGQGNQASGAFGFTNSPDNVRAGISGDGNSVAFMSLADNLVLEDTNLAQDVFVRDRAAGTTERVSVTSKGRQGVDQSGVLGSGADISDDGNLVVFDSQATNFVRRDVNGNADVFIHDRSTGTTVLVSRGLDGTPATGDSPVISGDGRFVAFRSSSQNLVAGHSEFDIFPHIYVYDVQTQSIDRIDVDSDEVPGNSQANNVEISQDGRYVAFDTFADNLVVGPGDGQGVDVFVRDRGDGTTHGVSTVGDTGEFEGNSSLSSISPDGLRVGFSSPDPTMGEVDTNGFTEDAFVAEWRTGTVRLVSRDSAGNQGQGIGASSFSPLVSADANSVIFSSGAALVPDDTNNAFDVYRRDLATGTTVRLAADDGENGSPVIASDLTPDGRFVSLLTPADLLPEDVNFAFDVYVLKIPAADLSLTMTDSPDPVVVRTNLTYTLTVRNLGPDAASGVTLTDRLPGDAVFVSATASQGPCTRTGSGSRNGLVTCAVGTIPAGGTATVTIVVSPSRTGTLTNTATVRASSPDANLANNSATATTTVRQR